MYFGVTDSTVATFWLTPKKCNPKYNEMMKLIHPKFGWIELDFVGQIPSYFRRCRIQTFA